MYPLFITPRFGRKAEVLLRVAGLLVDQLREYIGTCGAGSEMRFLGVSSDWQTLRTPNPIKPWLSLILKCHCAVVSSRPSLWRLFPACPGL